MAYFFNSEQNELLVEGLDDIPQAALLLEEKEAEQLLVYLKQGCQLYLEQNTVKATPPKPSEIHTWNGEKWIIDKAKQAELITQQREQIRQVINAKRDQTDASGVFVPQIGKWIDSDDKAYQNILGVKASLDLLGDMEIEWTWADNTSSTINRQTLAVIVGALLQAKQTNHANTIKHKEAVMQTDSPLEYDYSSGWTKTYADYVAETGNE